MKTSDYDTPTHGYGGIYFMEGNCDTGEIRVRLNMNNPQNIALREISDIEYEEGNG